MFTIFYDSEKFTILADMCSTLNIDFIWHNEVLHVNS